MNKEQWEQWELAAAKKTQQAIAETEEISKRLRTDNRIGHAHDLMVEIVKEEKAQSDKRIREADRLAMDIRQTELDETIKDMKSKGYYNIEPAKAKAKGTQTKRQLPTGGKWVQITAMEGIPRQF